MPWPRGLPQGDIDMTNEAFACMKIGLLLSAQGWDMQDANAVRFEVLHCKSLRIPTMRQGVPAPFDELLHRVT